MLISPRPNPGTVGHTTMSLFREYLEDTSVHGLRYLSVSPGAASKLSWFFCIAASFTVAFLICHSNVVQWNANPKVLTSVQSVTVSGNKIHMPTVTVCPRKGNLRSLVVNYLGKYYGDGEMFQGLEEELKLVSIRNRMLDNVKGRDVHWR